MKCNIQPYGKYNLYDTLTATADPTMNLLSTECTLIVFLVTWVKSYTVQPLKYIHFYLIESAICNDDWNLGDGQNINVVHQLIISTFLSFFVLTLQRFMEMYLSENLFIQSSIMSLKMLDG